MANNHNHKSTGIRYGLDNPHPLSQLKTELVWEGKYDEYGNRRAVDVAGCAMPLQRIETIDEPRSRAAAKGQMDMFESKLLALREKESAYGKNADFRNRLIWGDNKLVMASLLAEFKGRVDLIYIDPPFDVGADFTMDVPIGDEKETVAKDQSTLEMVAYRDMWGKGTDSYLHMMFERLSLMKELLSENGSVFVHVDYRVNGYVRTLLDDVFGVENFVNEIIWQKCNTKNYTSSSLSNVHDTIFFYAKTQSYRFNEVFEDLKPDYIETAYRYQDEKGRRYRLLPLHAPERRSGPTGGKWKGMLPLEGNHWRFHPDTLNEMDAKGLIEISKTGVPAYRKYLEDSEGVRIGTIWLDAKQLPDTEKVDYPTQKPTSIIEKVIRIGSNECDLVADFFCGSGTTGAVAERLGRRWIMSDLGRFAIHTSRKRLIELQRTLHNEGKPYRAFDVYNLGRYERQWWQKERLKGADEEHRKVVLGFYKAEVLGSVAAVYDRRGAGKDADDRRSQTAATTSPYLHGMKGRAFIYVDGIDSILTRDEVRAVAKAAREAGAKEVHCLAWEFEMDLRLVCHELEASEGVTIKLIPIPREIMEKNRKEPPPFLEVAVLEAEVVYRGAHAPSRAVVSAPAGHTSGPEADRRGRRSEHAGRVWSPVDIKLTKFLPSLAEVPTKELEALRERAVKSGFDFIDFWAVDFNWHEDKPFEHHWQDYRTRKDRSLKTVSDAGFDKYPKPGKYTACVKVVDVFGCDTSITVEVKV